MPTESPIRIAIREEGEWINAYVARRDSMDEAILVATMRKAIAGMPGGFDAFTSHCRLLANVIVDDVIGEGLFRGTVLEAAAEHERSGHG